MLTEQDRSDLQEDLDNLQHWAITWKMKFNADKCKVLHLGNQNPRYKYRIGDACLYAVRDEKDMGVIVDEKLKFDTHTVTQANKADRVLGLVRRIFDNLDEEMLVLLYKSLVRPHHAVVYPRYVKQEKMLEAVHRRATRLVLKIRKKEYPERLEKLKLSSLAYRRRRGDVIEVYTYTHDIYNVAVQPVEVEIRTTRGHSYKLLKKSSSTSQRQKFFSMRVVDSWNSLPVQVVTAPSVNTFKGRLDAHWDDLKFVVDFPAHELSLSK